MAKRKVVAEELKAPAVKGLLRDVPDPTVYLNGVLRFDDDHIIRVKYDPTTKAMVIDDVPQSLESSITLGGGGGASFVPLVKMKITVDQQVLVPKYPVLADNLYQYHDGRFYAPDDDHTDFDTVAANTAFEVQVIPTSGYAGGETVSGAYILPFMVEALEYTSSITTSNLVNCTYDSENEVVVVTDLSKDASIEASITITIVS